MRANLRKKNDDMPKNSQKALLAFRQELQDFLSSDASVARFRRAAQENPYFTVAFSRHAMEVWVQALDPQQIDQWLTAYAFPALAQQKKVGLVTAGNVPFNALHDILAVLVSGHKALIKTSSKDAGLTSLLVDLLLKAYPPFEYQLEVVDRLEEYDAIIATGSGNTSRYFEYYFKDVPHIIRRNRVGAAVLSGAEGAADFQGLAEDIFLYHGQGCRNVASLWVPEGYDLKVFCEHISDPYQLADHHLYANNYEYQRALMLMDKQHFFDTGFLLLQDHHQVQSPLSKLHVLRYHDEADLKQQLASHAGELQVVVGNDPALEDFGRAQKPSLWDYADGVDTVDFLLQLN